MSRHATVTRDLTKCQMIDALQFPQFTDGERLWLLADIRSIGRSCASGRSCVQPLGVREPNETVSVTSQWPSQERGHRSVLLSFSRHQKSVRSFLQTHTDL